MKILIADKLSPKAVESLRELGANVTMNPDLKAEDLPTAIGDAEILVVRSTKVVKETIEKATDLSLIIRAGAGVNTIDLETASAKGVHVANCPGKNTDAVAELAIGHLIACDRRIVSASIDMRDGKWRKKEYQKSAGLKGRVLGVVGLGSIGSAVARRAKGLEMRVIAWSRSLTDEKAEALGVERRATLNELAEQADAVSIHLAANADTAHLIGEDFLGRMKDGAILINTSRGEVVDTAALKKAIADKQLRVGLDVYENEPTGGEDDFTDADLAANATATPHVGASTDQAAEAIATEVVRVVSTYKETGKPVNGVNIQGKSKAIINLVVRHFNRVGVLAGVLDELRNADINIEEMENTIFEGGAAASCTLKLDDKPGEKVVAAIAAMENVIQVALK